MNKYTLQVSYHDKDSAISAGAIFQSHNKKWVYFGDELPASLAPFAGLVDLNIEDRCNTCFTEFSLDAPLKLITIKGVSMSLSIWTVSTVRQTTRANSSGFRCFYVAE